MNCLCRFFIKILCTMVLRGITYLPLLILVMAVMDGLLCIIGLLPFADRNKGIGHEYDCNELFGR